MFANNVNVFEVKLLTESDGLDFEPMDKQVQNVMVVWELGIWLAAFCVKSKRGQIGANNLGIGQGKAKH